MTLGDRRKSHSLDNSVINKGMRSQMGLSLAMGRVKVRWGDVHSNLQVSVMSL